VFDGRFRAGVDRLTRPLGQALVRTPLAPDHLTAAGLAMAVPAAWAIATGRLGLGLALLILTAVPDLLDGALAKASGRASVRGAFFDSVADRVSDTLILGAFAWYLLDARRGHLALLPVAILGASLTISYQRAKAEALGLEAKGGLMERAERIILLCACLAFGFVMVPLLWAMLGLTLATAVGRFVRVWQAATAGGRGPDLRQRRSRRVGYETGALSARWRAWREANARALRYRPNPGAGAAVGSKTVSTRWQDRRQARRAGGAKGEPAVLWRRPTRRQRPS